ncbi:MAG: hypothetical protein HYZ08_00705 [Candidatus Kerfeldbacteria bacterium]|nr:hypothetical protein [Candidatus Kerfeldbacteria bacterium]
MNILGTPLLEFLRYIDERLSGLLDYFCDPDVWETYLPKSSVGQWRSLYSDIEY